MPPLLVPEPPAGRQKPPDQWKFSTDLTTQEKPVEPKACTFLKMISRAPIGADVFALPSRKNVLVQLFPAGSNVVILTFSSVMNEVALPDDDVTENALPPLVPVPAPM